MPGGEKSAWHQIKGPDSAGFQDGDESIAEGGQFLGHFLQFPRATIAFQQKVEHLDPVDQGPVDFLLAIFRDDHRLESLRDLHFDALPAQALGPPHFAVHCLPELSQIGLDRRERLATFNDFRLDPGKFFPPRGGASLQLGLHSVAILVPDRFDQIELPPDRCRRRFEAIEKEILVAPLVTRLPGRRKPGPPILQQTTSEPSQPGDQVGSGGFRGEPQGLLGPVISCQLRPPFLPRLLRRDKGIALML